MIPYLVFKTMLGKVLIILWSISIYKFYIIVGLEQSNNINYKLKFCLIVQ